VAFVAEERKRKKKTKNWGNERQNLLVLFCQGLKWRLLLSKQQQMTNKTICVDTMMKSSQK
jgi:hypothetical protein